MARVALDAMGGDRAPLETVLGGAAAAERGYDVILVGDRAVLAPLVVDHESYLPIVHASEVIGMHEDPARAIREKPDASVSVAARLVRDGIVSAFVSAGSTGAALATAAITIGRLDGVDRPAVATMLPTPGSPTVLIDSGANQDCRPEVLPPVCPDGFCRGRSPFRVGSTAGRVCSTSERSGARAGNSSVLPMSCSKQPRSTSSATSKVAIFLQTPSMSSSPTVSPATSCSRPQKAPPSSWHRWLWTRWPRCRSRTRSESCRCSAGCGPGSTTRPSEEPIWSDQKEWWSLPTARRRRWRSANAIALAADGADRDLVKRLADRVT